MDILKRILDIVSGLKDVGLKLPQSAEAQSEWGSAVFTLLKHSGISAKEICEAADVNSSYVFNADPSHYELYFIIEAAIKEGQTNK